MEKATFIGACKKNPFDRHAWEHTELCEIETGRGTLHIVLGVNGTARIDKPNGTHKWVYEKTPAQITAQLKQIIKFYK
jgi:hypothetical protein